MTGCRDENAEAAWGFLELLVDSQLRVMTWEWPRMRENSFVMKENKFRKIVAIEDVLINDAAKERLQELAEEVEMHYDMPDSEEEIIRRIGSDKSGYYEVLKN